MPFVFKRLALVLSIAVACAADKETPFKAPAVTDLASRQSVSQLTIGVDLYMSGDKVKTAFGKLDPYENGVLPVLVVMQNDSNKAIRLEGLRVEYVGPDRRRVEATPAKDVRYLKPPERPNVIAGPMGRTTKILKPKKNPLNAWEIEGRSFAAKMLPAGQTATGFFYFQSAQLRDASVYLTGMSEAATGKELLYFEIPVK